MNDLMKRFKKKFTLAVMFWLTGTYIAISVKSGLGEYTAFTTVILALFAASDVTDKKLNGGQY